MFNNQLLTYSFIVFLLTMTPGADTMLVLRNVFFLAAQFRSNQRPSNDNIRNNPSV